MHGEQLQEGNTRIDSLDPDLVNGKDVDRWLEVLAVLNNSEMPPADGLFFACDALLRLTLCSVMV
jgi:hypothetical protein